MKIEKNLVSIVVMCYNNESLLKNTIDSIILQDYRPIEVIISDDCSREYDKNLIDSYVTLCQNKGMRVLCNHNEKNQGTVKHFNKLIKMSNGEYIFPLSCGDEFYEETTVSKLVASFKETNALILTAQRKLILENTTIIKPTQRKGKILHSTTKKILSHIYKFVDLISGANTYYKKEVFEKYGLFDESYVLLEDCPFYVKIMEQGEKIHFLEEVSIQYDCSGVSTGKKLHPLLQKDMITMFKKWEKQNLPFYCKRVIKYRLHKETAKNKTFVHICYFDVLLVLAYNMLSNKYRG